jgi:hypothetical protein
VKKAAVTSGSAAGGKSRSSRASLPASLAPIFIPPANPRSATAPAAWRPGARPIRVTLVNQAYRLMKSGVARRILFLVDRRALAAQAVNAFAAFEPEPGLKFDKIYEVYSQRFRREDLGEDQKFDAKVLPASYLLNPPPGHAFVYVCTIQRMATKR